jgi:hypothetical protein
MEQDRFLIFKILLTVASQFTELFTRGKPRDFFANFGLDKISDTPDAMTRMATGITDNKKLKI